MRVLALHLTAPSSSEANVLANLLKHLPDDIDVKLVLNRHALDDGRSSFPPTVAMRRVTIAPVDVGLPLDPQKPRPLPFRLASRAHHFLRRGEVVRVVEGFRLEIVYTSQQRFDCHIGELAARQLGVPQVVHLHYTPGPWLRASAMERIRTCDRVIAVSRFIGRLAEKHGVEPARVAVLPNTIEVRDAPAVRPTDRITVGQIGRLAPGKGFDDSVRAFARLRERMPAAELVLVGDGSERPRIERLVRELGLDGSVRFTGWQRNVDQWLAQLDVFINPSRDEPFGLAVLEASAAAIPVVAYDEGGVPEIIVHGETGLLAPPGDVAALGEALIRLCTDAALRKSLGSAARSRAATVFTPAVASSSFANILRSVRESSLAARKARS
jgi:glycosyltransferase involved in cell wall biosynthesis